MEHHVDEPARRRWVTRLGRTAAAGIAVLAIAGITGCGSVSRDDASSSLSSIASKSGLPNAAGYAGCVVGKLYDSGQFNSDEIQSIVKANDTTDLSSSLAARFIANVVQPCVTAITSSSSTSASSSSSSST
jgi:hypothetical protein